MSPHPPRTLPVRRHAPFSPVCLKGVWRGKLSAHSSTHLLTGSLGQYAVFNIYSGKAGSMARFKACLSRHVAPS
jgi:hypothetical protein